MGMEGRVVDIWLNSLGTVDSMRVCLELGEIYAVF